MHQFFAIIYSLIICCCLLSGCSFFAAGDESAPTAQYSSINYLSNDGQTLAVKYDTIGDRVIVTWDGETIALNKSVSGSGAQYSQPPFVFWNKGDEAMFIKDGSILFKGAQ